MGRQHGHRQLGQQQQSSPQQQQAQQQRGQQQQQSGLGHGQDHMLHKLQLHMEDSHNFHKEELRQPRHQPQHQHQGQHKQQQKDKPI